MGGIVSGLFGGGQEEAYKKFADQIQQGMGARKQYESSAEQALSPYMGDPRLQKQYEQAIAGGQDYQGLLNHLMGGYQESPYAKFLTEQGQRAIQHGGAASGMLGSGQEMQELQKNAMGIASGDLQQYLANALGLRSDYLNRLGGIAGTEAQQQYGARMGVGDWRNQLGGALAGDYQQLGQAMGGEEMAKAAGRNNLIGGIASAIGNFIPGIGTIAGDAAKYLFSGGSNNPFKNYNIG